MGWNPPPPLPTALERARNAYSRGRISFEEFERRVDYLLRNGLETAQYPMPYETPPPPPKSPKPAHPTYR